MTRRCAAAALLLAVAASAALLVCSSAPGVPAVYVFGDSLVDVGNNAFLSPPAPRAAFPCGLDLPPGGRSTGGRFTNGYNLADIVGMCIDLFACLLALLGNVISNRKSSASDYGSVAALGSSRNIA